MVEKAEWDSEFFGVSIGRVRLDDLTQEALVEIDTEARDLGIECLYGSLDPNRSDVGLLAQRRGWRMVEVAITLARPDLPFTPRPSASRARRGTRQDMANLDGLITTLAPWSRFAVDPRFGPEAARRMFEAWVRRAVEEQEHDERMLAISEDPSGITGLSTHVRSPVPRVDLMGVAKPGSGASWVLMAEFVDWAGGGEIEAGPCAARNLAVIRYLEHCGFSVARVEYILHRWLDEDPVAD